MVRLGLRLGLLLAWPVVAFAEDLERLESRLPILEEQVRMACTDERAGSARAALAYLSYSRATALTADLNREMAEVNRFLDSPEELAYRQLTEDLSKAREGSRLKFRAQLDVDVQLLDWMRLQERTDRPYSREAMDRQRDKVRQSKRTLDYYTRSDVVAESLMTPAQMRKLLAIKIDQATRRMRQIAALARRFDAASSKAWGCWVTATNSGKQIVGSALGATEPTGGATAQ